MSVDKDLLVEFRKVFVKTATWDKKGNVTSVEFFSPTEVLKSGSQLLMNQALSEPSPVEMEENPRIAQLRRAMENATTAEVRQHYQRQLDAEMKAQATYWSS